MILGGIEAGGTKWVCARSRGDGELLDTAVIPTGDPAGTLDAVARWFAGGDGPEALGVGAFGPVDVDRRSATYGRLLGTPKPGWSGADLRGPLSDALGVPVVLHTDVVAAAIGEWRWGAGRDARSLAYLTVGTGLGGGLVVDGEPLATLGHQEIGHLRVPHDLAEDPFPGCCPYHGDCLEGLASGTAMHRRWGVPAEANDSPAAWRLEAGYLAAGLVAVTYALAPDRIVLGGSVATHPGLLAEVRERLGELVGGYVTAPALASPEGIEGYVVAPGVAGRSGVLGAVELARREVLS